MTINSDAGRPGDWLYAGTETTDRAGDNTSAAPNNIATLGRHAVEALEHKRGAAASRLEQAASWIRQKVEPFDDGRPATRMVRRAADKLETTAGYVRQHEVSHMAADAGRAIRSNPGRSLMVAAAAGFLLARAFSRDDS
jgi:hypothetical protein